MSEATKDLRADALVASYERAGYAPRRARDPAAGRAVPRPVGRGHPPPHVSDQRSGRRRAVPAARSHHSGRARLSRLAGGRPAGEASAISARSSASARTARPSSSRPASNRSAAPTRRRPTPRRSRSRSRRPRSTASPSPTIRMGDVALFSAFIGALDLAPAWKRRLVKDFNRKSQPRARSRPPGAGAARTARPNTRACSPRSPIPIPRPRMRWSPICLSIAGITAVGGRSVGEIADRFLEQAALGAGSALPGETRELIERFLAIARRSRRGGGRAARARRRRQARARAGARPVREPHRLPGGARRRPARASASRPRSAAASTITPAWCSSCTTRAARSTGELVAGGRYDGLFARLGAAQPVPAVGFAVWIDGLVALGGDAPGGAA